MDGRVRELERRWAAGDPEAGSRYLQARQRAGETEFAIRVLLSGLFSSVGRNEFGLEEYLHDESGIVMVSLPAGEFLMGSTEGHEEERPQHKVMFHRPFLIAKYAVTQGDWKRVMGLDNNPSHFQGHGHRTNNHNQLMDQWGHPYDLHPVEQISWDDAQEFCRRTMLRLPTEAMWEYSCRAGTTTRYHSGDTERDLERVAWFGAEFNEGHRAVGLKEPNAFGLYDAHGNTYEWCQDPWHQTYEKAPENGFIAWGDDTGYNHALWVQGELEELTLQAVGARPPAEVVEEHPEEERTERRSAYGLSLKLAPDPTRPGQPPRPSSAPGPGMPPQEASTPSGALSNPSPPPTETGETTTSANLSTGSDQAGSPDPTRPARPAGSAGVVAGASSQRSAARPAAPTTGPAPRASTWDSDQAGSSDPTEPSHGPSLGPGSIGTKPDPGLAPTVAGDTPTSSSPSTDSDPPGSSDPTQRTNESLDRSQGPTGQSNGTGPPPAPSATATSATSSSASGLSGRRSFPVERAHVSGLGGPQEVQVDPDPTPGDGPRPSDVSSPTPPDSPHPHQQPSRRPSNGSRPSGTSASTTTIGRSSSALIGADEATPSRTSGEDSTASERAPTESRGSGSSAFESCGVEAELLDDPNDDVDLSIPYVSIAALDREDEPDPPEALGGPSSGFGEGSVPGDQAPTLLLEAPPTAPLADPICGIDPATIGGPQHETAASDSAGDERCSDPPTSAPVAASAGVLVAASAGIAKLSGDSECTPVAGSSTSASDPSGDEERSPDPTSASTLEPNHPGSSYCSETATTSPTGCPVGSSAGVAAHGAVDPSPAGSATRVGSETSSPRSATLGHAAPQATAQPSPASAPPGGRGERSSDPTDRPSGWGVSSEAIRSGCSATSLPSRSTSTRPSAPDQIGQGTCTHRKPSRRLPTLHNKWESHSNTPLEPSSPLWSSLGSPSSTLPMPSDAHSLASTTPTWNDRSSRRSSDESPEVGPGTIGPTMSTRATTTTDVQFSIGPRRRTLGSDRSGVDLEWLLRQAMNHVIQSGRAALPECGFSHHQRVNDLERVKQSIPDILLDHSPELFGSRLKELAFEAFRPRALRGAQRSSQRASRARTPLRSGFGLPLELNTVRNLGFRVCWA